ncbi:MAG TPA: leucyl aminopeptidase [Alphaproteobacteria bacterium]|nr:leucyl aminopeptidase [Alphaproteobacteria bacterium]
MKPSFAKTGLPKSGAAVVAVFEGRKLSPGAHLLDRAAGGVIRRAIAASRFKGGTEDALTILAPAGLNANRVLLLGLGKPDKIDAQAAERMGARLVVHLQDSGETEASVLVDSFDGAAISAPEMAARIAHGARLRAWRFDKYRTKEKPEEKPSLKKLNLLVGDPAEAKRLYHPLDKLADGVLFTRELVSEPANVIYPETLANEAQRLADLGVEVEVLGVKEMRKLGMGALLGVGQGSAHEPKLVVMQWQGDRRAKDQRPLAFVGKGVTFDTGGISIKPAAGMEEMKWDMAGAGAVIGLMRALAGRKAKINAIGVVGLVENMPSGTAQRPGDIVTSASGQTIEVINTDAEGRLVLADALWYAQDRFKPRLIVDLATLTGAIIISLGHVHAGLFSNDDALAEALIKAGRETGEPLWRMPLGDEYDKAIKSDAADMKNTGERAGGSISAAQFLKRFVDKAPWAHLDIAGMAWSSKDRPLSAKGATGFGVRLLDRFVAEQEG